VVLQAQMGQTHNLIQLLQVAVVVADHGHRLVTVVAQEVGVEVLTLERPVVGQEILQQLHRVKEITAELILHLLEPVVEVVLVV